VRLSYIVWALWLAIFLALELPAVFHAVPWVTFSSTSMSLERDAWPVHALVLGFGLGLVVHIGLYAGMWRSQALGMLVSFGLHLVNRHWP